MKTRIIFGALIIVLGLPVAIGPQTMFKPCQNMLKVTNGQINEDGEVVITREVPMRCVWGARSLMGIGGMIALLGVAMIVFTSVKIRLGLAIGTLFSGIIALFIPTNVLVGVCIRAEMLCRQGFTQAVTSISILSIAVCVLYIVMLVRKKE